MQSFRAYPVWTTKSKQHYSKFSNILYVHVYVFDPSHMPDTWCLDPKSTFDTTLVQDIKPTYTPYFWSFESKKFQHVAFSFFFCRSCYLLMKLYNHFPVCNFGRVSSKIYSCRLKWNNSSLQLRSHDQTMHDGCKVIIDGSTLCIYTKELTCMT